MFSFSKGCSQQPNKARTSQVEVSGSRQVLRIHISIDNLNAFFRGSEGARRGRKMGVSQNGKPTGKPAGKRWGMLIHFINI